MTKKILFLMGAGFAVGMLAPRILSAAANDDDIKGLMRRYTQVESQLDRAIHYQKSEKVEGVTTTRHAWFNGANDLIKVALESSGPSGRELAEYVAEEFDSYTTFVLTRKETPLGGGDTQIDEARRYFVGGNLVRELRKTGRFKPGDSLDTVHLPNVTVAPPKELKDQRAEEERRRAQNEFLSGPAKIAAELRKAGPAQTDPFAAVKGDTEKFRVIHGSVSPDGRYAIALGFARAEIDWDVFIDKDYEVEGMPTYEAETEEDVKNYVVDLTSQKILGETGCDYFGTRQRYNHRECTLIWSEDAASFVQLWSDKWEDSACVAGQIAPGPKLTGVTNLLKVLETKTQAFLKKRTDTMPGLSLSVDRVSNDGRIELKVSASISSGDRKGDTLFNLAESVQLRKTSNGVRAEVLNIRRLPNDQ